MEIEAHAEFEDWTRSVKLWFRARRGQRPDLAQAVEEGQIVYTEDYDEAAYQDPVLILSQGEAEALLEELTRLFGKPEVETGFMERVYETEKDRVDRLMTELIRVVNRG